MISQLLSNIMYTYFVNITLIKPHLLRPEWTKIVNFQNDVTFAPKSYFQNVMFSFTLSLQARSVSDGDQIAANFFSLRRCIFPVADLGMDITNSTPPLKCLKSARLSSENTGVGNLQYFKTKPYCWLCRAHPGLWEHHRRERRMPSAPLRIFRRVFQQRQHRRLLGAEWLPTLVRPEISVRNKQENKIYITPNTKFGD